MTDFLRYCWLRRVKASEDELPMWQQRTGSIFIEVRNTTDKWAATRFTEDEKNRIGPASDDIYEWEKLNLKVEVTLDDLRERLADRPMWAHALKVIDVIEDYMKKDEDYRLVVECWLTNPHKFSTVWLRDDIMEPLRQDPILVEIGKQFNPTTEWHNTWMPLDTTIHCVRNGMKIGE